MNYRLIKKEDLSNYELENKRLSYANLFCDGDSLILCNNIVNDYEELTQESGFTDDDELEEIYQYFIIDDSTAERLKKANEIVFYHERLDIYILGVTHFGTGWKYVLTDIKLIDNNDGWYMAQIKEDAQIELLENEG